MATKLFCGGLSWSASDASLREAFSEFGEVSDAKVITDRETGKSRGFGFVTFRSPEDAANALDAMNGASLDGRTITVSEASERPQSNGDRNTAPRRDPRGTTASRQPPRPEPEVTRRPSSARRDEPQDRDYGEGISPAKGKNRKSTTPPPERMFVERVVRSPVREPVGDTEAFGGTDEDSHYMSQTRIRRD